MRVKELGGKSVWDEEIEVSRIKKGRCGAAFDANIRSSSKRKEESS
jgi:hypothetical protein